MTTLTHKDLVEIRAELDRHAVKPVARAHRDGNYVMCYEMLAKSETMATIRSRIWWRLYWCT
ncbi:MAG: hypothetical protein V3U84_07025 [Thiotrichaceae bacterium]